MKPTSMLVFVSLTAFGQSDLTTTVLERGQDYAIHQTVQAFTDTSGRAWRQTNDFTLLENALHYLDNGQWKESQDVIEPFPDGAVARYGPHRAIFSADLNAEAVFDIQAADGQRIRGGIRTIRMNDLGTGESITIGTVRDSVKGQLLPPNRIVYEDAFDGIQADVVLVWKHNLFSHDVILREQPGLPAHWDPANVRLEVLTEFIVESEPELRTQIVQAEGQPALEDDAVIHFGSLAMVMGKAFRTAVDSELALGGLNDDRESIPVLKQWYRTEDGGNFLVESVGWLEVGPMLEDLPVAALADRPSKRNTEARLKDSAIAKESSPMQVAAVEYEPWGCVLDFVIIPDQGTPTTLLALTTYYIRTSYYSGSSVTFQPGCVIKFKNNAYMLLYGPVTFPTSIPYAVFTSRNDDLFGQRITGVQGEMNSNADPTLHLAAQTVWIYYVNFATTVRYAQIRWATQGVRYDMNSGVGVSHYLQNSLLQNCGTGIYVNPNSSVELSSVQKCDVTVNWTGGGEVKGSMTTWSGCDTLVNSAANDLNNPDPQQNTQNETAVTVSGSRIVAAWMDTNKGHNSLGNVTETCKTVCELTGQVFEVCPGVQPRFLAWGVTSNGGQSFVDKGEPPRFQYTPVGGGAAYVGDAGDPILVSFGNTVYLTGNPQRPATYQPQGSPIYRLYMPLWKSTDQGQTFANPVNIAAISTPMSGAPALTPTDPNRDFFDKPWLAVNPANGNLYLAVTWQKYGTPAERTVIFFRSLNGGVSWSHREFAEAGKTLHMPYLCFNGGTIYLFWRTYDESDPIRIRKSTDEGFTFTLGGQNGVIQSDAAIVLDANLLRNSHDDGLPELTNDLIRAPSIFQVAVNPAFSPHHVYLVYHDRSPDTDTDTDILFRWSANGGTTWTAPVRLNNVEAGDQWQPCIVVRPGGSKLFVGWYDRGHDTQFNHRIRARGMISTITAQSPLTSQTFFDISAEDFAPVVTGDWDDHTQESPGTFDPVYGGELHFDYDQGSHPVYGGECDLVVEYRRPSRLEFHMGDYDQVTADNSYVYYCWGDNRTRRSGRLQPDVRFKRIPW